MKDIRDSLARDNRPNDDGDDGNDGNDDGNDGDDDIKRKLDTLLLNTIIYCLNIIKWRKI